LVTANSSPVSKRVSSGWRKANKKPVHIEPAQALGEKRPELISSLPRLLVPEQVEDLKVGSSVAVKDNNGNDIKATVTELSDQRVTIDANHLLAGQALTSDIELIEFVKAGPSLMAWSNRRIC